MTAMKIVKWTLTISVITWTKMILQASSLLLILDQSINFEWYSGLVEIQFRRPRPGFGKPSHSSEGTESTWNIPSGRN
jgi:hypothetical protein